MTDPNLRASSANVPSNLSALKLAELQQLASQLGVGGVSKLRKQDLVNAITEHRASTSAGSTAEPTKRPARSSAAKSGDALPDAATTSAAAEPAAAEVSPSDSVAPDSAPRRRGSRRVSSDTLTATPVTTDATADPSATAPVTTAGSGKATAAPTEVATDVSADASTDASAVASTDDPAAAAQSESDDAAANGGRNRNRSRNRRGADRTDGNDARGQQSGGQQSGGRNTDRNTDRKTDRNTDQAETPARGDRSKNARSAEQERGTDQGRGDHDRGADQNRSDQNRADQGRGADQNRGPQSDRAEQDADGRNRTRGRGRDRKRGPGGDEFEPEISDDDVLIPVAGILDVLDNYAFVRTTGYLPGPSDVYVSLGQVKKYSLRKGDAVVGAIRQPRDGEGQGRQKYNALVRVDSVNGQTVDEAAARVEFSALTALFPSERLRLETTAAAASTRLLDVVAPLGKGQRGLIVSPPKAGKTLMLQAIADAIAKNNPEVHLMVVLVDERPEEVTEMQRLVKGEVIASTFDRPAEDHTTVAELAIERAKRLVELGHDVVVLLDSITRLSRAYIATTPASGRVMSGALDPSALAAPKRIFSAARNIDDGGSLTILATALIETGSKIDEMIVDEFTGTDNLELRLSRQLADKRIFPAVDITASGTLREELLLGADEVRVTGQLRKVLADLSPQQALEMVLSTLAETSSNVEFLVAVQKARPQVVASRTAH